MRISLHTLLPQYQAIPLPRFPILLRGGLALILVAAFVFWFYFNQSFLGFPVQVPFSASLGLFFLLSISLRLWPVLLLLQTALLIAQGGSGWATLLLLSASYLDFLLITRLLNRMYKLADISAFDPRTIFTLLAPCALSFLLLLGAMWWANVAGSPLATLPGSIQLIGILFLLGLLERTVAFSLLFSHYQQSPQSESLVLIISLALVMALYTFGLRTLLGYSPAWLYTLLLIFPAFIIPFTTSLTGSSWASLAGVMGMLIAIMSQPTAVEYIARLNYNIVAVLLLTTLLQNGFAILRATFGSLRMQEQKTNQRIREVLNIAPVLICSYERDGSVHFWNKACEQSLGWSHDELMEDPELFRQIFPSIDEQRKYAFPAPHRNAFSIWQPLNKARQPQQILWGSFPISGQRFMGIGIDLSQQIQAKLQLERTRRHYIKILKKIPIGVFTLRQKTPGHYQFDFVNPFFADIVQLPIHVILGNPEPVFSLWHKENKRSLFAARRAFEEGQGFCLVNRITIRGEPRWLRAEFNVSTLDSGERIANGVLVDITAEREQTRRLSIAGHVLREMHEGLLILDAQLNIILCNPAVLSLTGYTEAEILNQPVQSLFARHSRLGPDSRVWTRLQHSESWHGEIAFYTKDQSKKHLQVLLSRVQLPFEQPEQFIIMLSDITPFKAREQKLLQMANFDLLTGLATRRLLYDRLNQAIAYTARNRQVLAICYIDLNDFKKINDQFGHQAGDQLLTEFSARLRHGLRQNDTAARMGGDEIVVLLSSLHKRKDAAQVLQQLTARISQPYRVLNRYQVRVSASIGVNFFDARHYHIDDPLPTASELIQQADQAMYLAKAKGNGAIHYHAG